MTTARDESGYGAGGKFRKRPFRRTTQATPYDRPPLAAAPRNTANVNFNNNNGWLSKLVDPAHRLIVSSAHRLFGSVFRKRLTPPPAPSTPLERGNHEAEEKHQELVSTYVIKDDPGVQGAINSHDGPSDSSDRGLNELEQILKQKTFTRSEIDRLTALLQSRTNDIPLGDDQKRLDVIPSKPVVSHERKEAFLSTPVKENGIVSHHVTTSVVLDEDVASPAELAKAYMGSRPSKVSPSMLGARSQALREESPARNNRPVPSAAPIMTLVPRSSGQVGVPENGFLTPRSRGRSAIYSMVRTPYSRVHSTTAFKGAGLVIDSFSGPSSSQSTWEKNRLTEPKQGTLKRRSSVLDNDIGSVGPIRRIRQKPNLLTSKNLSLPASGSPLSLRGSGASNAVQQPLMQKPPHSSEQKHGFTKPLAENGDNSIPSTSFTPVHSKSSEMASKILQQLDKLVSSRERSPTKLSPSMLHGQALKSLEHVDSSIFLENVQDNNKSDGSLDTSLPDARDSTSQKQDKVEENGQTKFAASIDKSVPALNGVDADGVVKDDVPCTKTTDSALTNSVAHPYPQKKRGFQMSAHEDYLDLDDDDYSNGTASTTLMEGRDKLDAPVVENKSTADEALTVKKSPPLSEVKTPGVVLNKPPDTGAQDGCSVSERSSFFTFPAAPSSCMTGQQGAVVTSSTLITNKPTLPNESSAAPVFSFAEKVASPKESNVVSPIFGTSAPNVDKVPQFTVASATSAVNEYSAPKFSTSLDKKPESSNSFGSVPDGATVSVPKLPESDKAENGIIPKPGVFFRTPETALSSAASTPSSTDNVFSNLANNPSLNNGSLASNPSTSSPIPPLVSSTGTNEKSFSASTVAFSNSTTSGSTPAPASAPVFKFGTSAVSATSASPMSSTSGLESTEARVKDSSFGNSTSMLFGGTSPFSSTGTSSSSGTSLAVASTGNNIFGGASLAGASTGSGLFCGTSLTGASTGSGIFGGTSSVGASTGNSIFGGTSSAGASTGSSVFGVVTPITSTGGGIFGSSSAASTSAGGSIFGFSAGATSSAAFDQAQVSNPFSAGSAQASVNATGAATSTQSTPIQFGSSSSSTFGLAGNPAFSSSSSGFSSSTSAAKPFGSTPTFGLSSTPSSEANPSNSSSGPTASIFGSSWQAPKGSALFGSTFNSSSPSIGFQFGALASSAPTSSASVFGSSNNATSGSIFPFTSAAAAPSSQPAFGNANPVFAFGSTPSNNSNNSNDQMGMEDSMAEDTVQSSTPAVPVFGQQPVSPSSGFVFGSTAPSGANPFQVGSQQSLGTPQNTNPFQASGSLEFNAGGSFSLGSVDRSQRKIVKVKGRHRKK